MWSRGACEPECGCVVVVGNERHRCDHHGPLATGCGRHDRWVNGYGRRRHGGAVSVDHHAATGTACDLAARGSAVGHHAGKGNAYGRPEERESDAASEKALSWVWDGA